MHPLLLVVEPGQLVVVDEAAADEHVLREPGLLVIWLVPKAGAIGSAKYRTLVAPASFAFGTCERDCCAAVVVSGEYGRSTTSVPQLCA